MAAILCVDDEPAVGVVLERFLADLGHQPVVAGSVDDAIRHLGARRFDLLIADCALPDRDAFDLLEYVRSRGLELPAILMSGYAFAQQAVDALEHGAVEYLTKPLRAESVRIAVHNALEMDRLRRENLDARREIAMLRGRRLVLGEGRTVRDLMDAVDAVAPTRAPVLLRGEVGTGKDLVAWELHERSPRRDHPFVSVNCAATPAGLLESVLFGDDAATDGRASDDRSPRVPGAFERAGRGTLLLLEIAEVRPALQEALFRAIHDREIRRADGSPPIQVEARVVATTSRDLGAEVEAGRFRRDLYFHLSVVTLRTPPLRERLEDLPALADYFAARSAQELGLRKPEILPETLEYLRRRTWPGNLRELANAVERAMIVQPGAALTPESFGKPRVGAVSSKDGKSAEPGVLSPLAALGVSPNGENGHGDVPLEEDVLDLHALERIAIRRALMKTNGHKTKAAELLGINERTLRNKLKAEPLGPLPPAVR